MTDKLPMLSGAECVKALSKAGFYVDRQRGSHIMMRRDLPPPAKSVVVPDHREIDRGTLRGIIRQAGLTVEGFLELLD